MSIKNKIAAAAAVLFLAGGLGVATSAPAHASSPAICTSGGENNNGDCMNAWSGGPAVYAYLPNKSNEIFSFESTSRCGSGYVTSNCPFNNHGQDAALGGDQIVEITYGGGGCVADASKTGFASLGSCSDSGGAFGNMYVVAKNNSLVDVGWTNQDGNWVQLTSLAGGSHQLQYVYLDPNPTEWTPQ